MLKIFLGLELLSYYTFYSNKEKGSQIAFVSNPWYNVCIKYLFWKPYILFLSLQSRDYILYSIYMHVHLVHYFLHRMSPESLSPYNTIPLMGVWFKTPDGFNFVRSLIKVKGSYIPSIWKTSWTCTLCIKTLPFTAAGVVYVRCLLNMYSIWENY